MLAIARQGFVSPDVVDDVNAVVSVESVCEPGSRFGAVEADVVGTVVVAGEGVVGGCNVRKWRCDGASEEG